jgi:hypothetical protein
MTVEEFFKKYKNDAACNLYAIIYSLIVNDFTKEFLDEWDKVQDKEKEHSFGALGENGSIMIEITKRYCELTPTEKQLIYSGYISGEIRKIIPYGPLLLKDLQELKNPTNQP